MPVSRSFFGAAALVAAATITIAGARFALRAAAVDLPRARATYRRYLEERGARILATDSAALQRTASDCGVAVLGEALRAVGLTVPSHDSLARLAGLRAYGTTLAALARAARLSGARVLPHDRRRRVLGEHFTIAHFSFGHFVLVRDFESSNVSFFDPLVGEVSAPAALFDRLWSGGAFGVARRGAGSIDAKDTAAPSETTWRSTFSGRKP